MEKFVILHLQDVLKTGKPYYAVELKKMNIVVNQQEKVGLDSDKLQTPLDLVPVEVALGCFEEKD